MKKTVFMDKYPVFSLEISKNETNFKDVDAIIEYLDEKVSAHPVAVKIAVFDHYAHTQSLEGGEVAEDIKNVKNFLFCFGKQLPNTKMAAVRPRSVAVCELKDSFVLETLEVPNEQLHDVVEGWLKSIANS
jgi:hypothetical protein